jgi:hypothetical protein
MVTFGAKGVALIATTSRVNNYNIMTNSLCLLSLLALLPVVDSFSAEAARSKLAAAFASPSGKLTLSPELVIPEPRDPTSILLLSNAVQTLSERIRLCKTNAAFLQGSLTALQTFTNEQSTAFGNFPGPVPVIYCDCSAEFDEVASAGADGVMIPVCGSGVELKSFHEIISSDATWVELCRAAVSAGLQPIPEVTIGQATAASWSEGDVESLIAAVVDAAGMEPVSIVLTVNTVDDDQTEPVTIPVIPKAAAKRVPILGSVRAMAGDNRLSEETMRFKDAGYSGTVLRSDCVPGFRLQPNLEIVGKFWQACITDLKSTRSKSFSFRSKNKMNVSTATKWGNYQQSVIESGALGDPDESSSVMDSEAGDYQGFA